MTRLFDCGVLLRTYTMIIAGLYSFTALLQPETMIYQVAHADRFAELTMLVLAVLVVLGTIDLVINDLMPAHYVIHRALNDRHLVNMAIAGCFAVQMWTCVKHDLSASVLPFYAVHVLMIPASAFADVRKRYKNARSQTKASP